MPSLEELQTKMGIGPLPAATKAMTGNDRRFIPDQYLPASEVNPSELRPLKRGEYVDNLDGTRSTERTASFNIEGKEVLVPSIWMSPRGPVDLFEHPDLLVETFKNFEARSGSAFPRFDTVGELEKFARGRSSGGAVFSGPLAKPSSPTFTKTPSLADLQRKMGITSDYVPIPGLINVVPSPSQFGASVETQMRGIRGGVAEFGADVLGEITAPKTTGIEEKMRGFAKEEEAKGEKAAELTRIKDFREIEDWDDFTDWLKTGAGAAVVQLPYFATAAVAGGPAGTFGAALPMGYQEIRGASEGIDPKGRYNVPGTEIRLTGRQMQLLGSIPHALTEMAGLQRYLGGNSKFLSSLVQELGEEAVQHLVAETVAEAQRNEKLAPFIKESLSKENIKEAGAQVVNAIPQVTFMMGMAGAAQKLASRATPTTPTEPAPAPAREATPAPEAATTPPPGETVEPPREPPTPSGERETAPETRPLGDVIAEIDAEITAETPAPAEPSAPITEKAPSLSDLNWRISGELPVEPIVAYHGTPHEFERFDISKIGTGEGAQAYGHGLYFAESPGVARSYQEALTTTIPGASEGSSKYLVSGVEFPKGRAGHGALDTANEIEMYLGSLKQGSLEMAAHLRETLDRQIPARAQRDQTGAAGEDIRALADFWQKIRDVTADDVVENRGRLYQVKIKARPDEFLDWDKPLSEQPKVSALVEDMVAKSLHGEDTLSAGEWVRTRELPGAGLANFLRQDLGSSEATAETFRKAGIKGIRYLDQQSRYTPANLPDNPIANEARGFLDRAGGDAQRALEAFDNSNPVERFAVNEREEVRRVIKAAGRKVTYNYVVFDDSIVEITHKDGTSVTQKERKDYIQHIIRENEGRGTPKGKPAERGPEYKPRPDVRQLYTFPGPLSEVVRPVTDAYQRRADQVLDAMAAGSRKIGLGGWPFRDAAIGTLPERDRYLTERGLAKGRVFRVNEVARHFNDIFRRGDKESQKAALEYLTTKGADPKSIPDPKVRNAAVAAKSTIKKVGKEMVRRGLLSQESYDKHHDAYLPRVYLKHLMAGGEFGTGLRTSPMGYLKQRKDLDSELREIILGQVEDPGFLAAKAISLPARDMAILDFLRLVSQNPDWVLQQSLVEYRGAKVTPFWLKSEAGRLRDQARRMEEPKAARAKEIAEEMDRTAEEGLEARGRVPDDYRELPDSPRYGELRGLVVRKEVFQDIIGAHKIWVGDQPLYSRVAQKLGDFNAFWKMMKVPLNPPTQVRNFVSNSVLLNISGVDATKLPGLYLQALKELVKNGPHARIAKRHGIQASTFTAEEIYKLRPDLLRVKGQKAGMMGQIHRIAEPLSRATSKASDLYQFLETWGKVVKIIDEMNKGSTEAQAVLEANKALFDYSLVPGPVRSLRTQPIGAPFITFYYKAAPQVIESVIKRPGRILPYIVLPYVLSDVLIASLYDVTEDDVDRLREALPEWLRERGHTYIFPVKDKTGRWVPLDYGYFLPWAVHWQTTKSLAQGKPSEMMTELGVLGGPVPQIGSAILSGIDPWTERPIIDKNDPPDKQAYDLVTYAWRMGAPTWLTDIGVAGHLYRSMTNTPNYYGDPPLTGLQAAARAVGVNVYPIDPVESRRRNLSRQAFEIRNLQSHARRQMKNKGLSEAERDDLRQSYRAEIEKRKRELQDYAKASEVHPALR